MTTKQVELLVRMFAHVVNPPKVKLDEDCNLDEPTIVIDDGWYIRNEKVDGPPSILGTKQVDGFVLEKSVYRSATRWQPEECDYAEVASGYDFVDIAKRAVQEYVVWKINNMLDDDSWAAYAAELEKEKQDLADAQKQGHDAFPNENNPYPYGISHWYAWKKGWGDAEYEEMRKEHTEQVFKNTGKRI